MEEEIFYINKKLIENTQDSISEVIEMTGEKGVWENRMHTSIEYDTLYCAGRIYIEEKEMGIERTIFSKGRNLSMLGETFKRARHFLWRLENDILEEPQKELLELMSSEEISVVALMQMVISCCINPIAARQRLNALIEECLK